MKIKTIEYENFRNFKDRGKITFSTDGRVTIIYGHSGDGKTTLHQLFQWVLYGKVNFNKTATDKLYNLQDEHDRKYGEEFNVFGEIEFEHDGDDYLLRRTHMYKKELKDSRLISEEFTLHKFDKKNYDWKKVSRINELVEEFLPSGLKDYFFFDGESMIADLRVKGKDSASSLKKALYNMFDLDILQNAIDHIGRTDLTTTVLGKLYIDKANGVDSKEVQECKINIENAQKRIEQFKEKKFELEHEKQNLHDVSQNVSEQIGSLKSKMQYETERRTYKKQCEAYNNALLQAQAEFGDALFQMVPQRLISKTVIDAKAKINLKVENTDLPSGITKKLIHYLLDEKNENCICGRKLDLESKQQIANYLLLMPPKSYASLYHEFSQAAKRQGEVYDKNYIEEIITRAVQNQQLISETETRIREIDEQEKKSPDIEDLVVLRENAEQRIKNELEPELDKLSKEVEKLKIYLKKRMKEYDELTEKNAAGEDCREKIEIMNSVLSVLENRLETESLVYSKKLEENIQSLVDRMLTSKRKVTVSSEFAVRITDNYDDESKSEGQFAVVSFAYIGGILKMLRSGEHFSNKEYPLVLDGPFSKVDSGLRQNIVNLLPEFAPQVIIFSKDDLHSVFAKENIGRVWTIEANETQNVASVREGKTWK